MHVGCSQTEVDKIFDVPDEYLAGMLVFAKLIVHAIEKAFDCKRCGISVIGLEVPHAHMHLVLPIHSSNDLEFHQRPAPGGTERHSRKIRLSSINDQPEAHTVDGFQHDWIGFEMFAELAIKHPCCGP